MIFITGLTGLVGSGLAYYLKEHKDKYNPSNVVALVRSTSYIEYIKDIATIEVGDSHSDTCLDNICSKYHFDTLIHISNKFQIPQFAKLAVRHNIKKVIMISSTYGLSHGDIQNNEMMEKENYAISLFNKVNIDYIFLRPTSVYGTRPDGIKDRNISIFTKYVLSLPLFPLFNKGKASVQPIHGKEVGNALYICLEDFNNIKNNRYIISGKEKMSFKEMILTIAKKHNKKIHFIYLPGWLGKFIFYSLYYLSFKHIDKREQIDRLLEDRAFPSSEVFINKVDKNSFIDNLD